MYQRRVVGLVLSLAAIVLMLGAVMTETWWGMVEGERSAHVGLRTAEVCDPGAGRRTWEVEATRVECREGSLRKLFRQELLASSVDESPDDLTPGVRRVPRTFIFLGTFAFIAGLAAVVALAATALAALAGGAPRTRALPAVATIASGAFAAFSIAFMIAAPGEMQGLRGGPGFALAIAGAAAGVAAGVAFASLDPAREPTARALLEADAQAPVGRAPGLVAGAIGAALVVAALFTHTWFHARDDGRTVEVGVQEYELCGRAGWVDEPASPECTRFTLSGEAGDAREPLRMRVFLRAGTMAWWTGLGSVVAYVLCGLLVLLRQPVGGRFAIGRVLAGVAVAFAAASIVYVVSKPKEAAEVSVSYGAFVAIAGAAALVAGGVMLGRWIAAMKVAEPVLAPVETSAPVIVPLAAPLAPPTYAAPPAPEPAPPLPDAPSPFAPPWAQQPAAAAPQPPPPAPQPGPLIPACPTCATPMLWVTAKNGWLCTICRTR